MSHGNHPASYPDMSQVVEVIPGLCCVVWDSEDEARRWRSAGPDIPNLQTTTPKESLIEFNTLDPAENVKRHAHASRSQRFPNTHSMHFDRAQQRKWGHNTSEIKGGILEGGGGGGEAR